jgi:carbonic anhydrase/acetyltransferase-like protein (isoleucine patch superfamily)
MSIRSFKNTFPKIASSAYIDESAVIIGDVEVGEDASIWPMCSIRGDVNLIRIGARSNIQDGCVIHVTHRYSEMPEGQATRIGSDVTVGHKVMLHGCTVENLCLIGMGSTLLDGAIIRSRVLLGAGSLVPEGKDLEGGYLWLGRPAKKMRELTEQELKWFEYSALHYVKLKNDYLG